MPLEAIAAAALLAALPALPLKPCRVREVEEEVRCGRLTVPEDRSLRGGRTLSLRVVVLPATLPTRPPIFILQGGPGQAASDLSSFYSETFAEARRDRDIVLVDQRGTGGSNPLACRSEGTTENPQGHLEGLFPLRVIRRCRSDLEDRADLRRYGTAEAIADLDSVRAALGYDRLSLYGTSYGTRVALYYLHRYPKRVESMILKGVVAPDEIVPIDFARNAERSLNILVSDCAADASCTARFPRLRSDVEATFARLESGKVRATIDREGQAPATIALSRDVVAASVRSLLQSTSSQASLPSLFTAAAAGDFGPFAETILRIREAAAAGVYQGMMLSVLCTEDAPLIPTKALRRDRDTFLRTYWTASLVEACRLWPRGRPPRDLRSLRQADFPVLLISGHADPATPPAGAERVMRRLPNSRHLIVRNGSHSFSGMRGCVDRVMVTFLAELSPQTLEIGCAARIPRPAWAGAANR